MCVNAGVNLDRAHQGIYTELGILYAKYKEEKLMEHINLFYSRLNTPTLIATCKECGTLSHRLDDGDSGSGPDRLSIRS